MLYWFRFVVWVSPVAPSNPALRRCQRIPAVLRPSPMVQSFGSGIRDRYCGPTQTGSIRVRNGSFTSLKRLNEFKNSGVPVAGSALYTFPWRFTDGGVANAFPFRRLVPPALPGEPAVRYRKIP